MPPITKIINENICLCKILSVKPTYLIVKSESRIGICHISEISDYRISNINTLFHVGEVEHFYLLSHDTKTNKSTFSYKAIRPELLKWHYCIIPTISGYNNLYQQTTKQLNSSLSATE